MSETLARKCPRCLSLLIGRHCLPCGYSQPPPLPEGARLSPTNEDLLLATRKQGRDDRLIALLAKHSLTLPRNAAEWRAVYLPDGSHPKGEILGLNLYVHLLLTDGVTAWFLTGDSSPFYGHFSNFIPDEPDEVEKILRSKKPSARAQTLLTAMAQD